MCWWSDPTSSSSSQVEDLFYNIPTRRKAFRSVNDEYTKILDLVGKYAIHCSGVAFTCKKHGDASMGVTVQQSASTVDRIRTIHGSAVANELIQIETKSEQWGFKADGWVSNANYHVKKLVLLLFINHRSVESSAIKRAVEQSFATFLPKGGHPFVYLSLEIEPHRVDVNVHPTKREVHFLHEDEIIEGVCGEIRERLGKVDTSRTFMTQSLLPGVRVPTISADTASTPRKIMPQASLPTPDDSTRKQSYEEPQKRTPRTPAPKPYENNLVRTDTNLRKITSMLAPAQRPAQPARSALPGQRDQSSDLEECTPALPMEESITYTLVDRERTVCRLTSVKALRANVRELIHKELTETFATHTFVGIVDYPRRIAAIQSGTNLFLVDYGMISNEFFYQAGLTEFGNFGTTRYDPPLSLREILQIAASAEAERNTDPDPPDWEEVVEVVEEQLIARRAMLAEYFSLEISEDGYLLSTPILVKGYAPTLAKMPQFLLRLGPFINWVDEQACFKSFLRELASWHIPEMLPPPPPKTSPSTQGQATQADDDVDMDAWNQATGHMPESEDPYIAARRREVHRVVENILFPAFKARLIATHGMLKGVVEVANLKGLYRVFERC